MTSHLDPTVQHSASAFFISAPLIAIINHFPEYMTNTLTLLGISWYLLLWGEKIYKWIKKKPPSEESESDS